MALTRKFLRSMNLTDEQIDSIIEEHTSTISGLKSDIDKYKEDMEKYKEDASKLPTVQKELDDLKTATADYDEWKTKYNDEHTAFETYKKEIAEADSLTKVKDAYRALLKAQNVDDKRIDTILKVTNFADKKLNKEGKFEKETELAESIKAEWKDFIVTKEERGAPVETPPTNTGGKKLTKDEIMKIKDTGERQKAIMENPDLFGIG